MFFSYLYFPKIECAPLDERTEILNDLTYLYFHFNIFLSALSESIMKEYLGDTSGINIDNVINLKENINNLINSITQTFF
jgi:hypothetical protein